MFNIKLRKIFFLIISFIFFLTYSYANELEIEPEEVLRKVDSYRGYEEPFSMDIEIIDYRDKNKENSLKLTAHVKNRGASFLKYIYPPIDKGKILLMVNENIWFYHKKISKPLRLSPRQRLLGNVSNADVARANFSYDYIPIIVGQKNNKKNKMFNS